MSIFVIQFIETITIIWSYINRIVTILLYSISGINGVKMHEYRNEKYFSLIFIMFLTT
jgi:hypothetical protein